MAGRGAQGDDTESSNVNAGTLAANGQTIHYVRSGAGPDLVWLPGGNDYAELALYAQRGLGPHFRFTGVDPRGQGLSSAPADPESYAGELLVADLLAVFDALALNRPLLGGHSRGSRLALEFAARHPARVAAAVAVCTPALGGARGRGERYRVTAAGLRNQGLEAFIAASRTAPRNPERRQEWADRLRRAGLEALCAQYEALARRPFLAELMEGYAVPTMIVTGEHDHLRPDCEALVEAVPGLTLAVIPGAGHAPMTENSTDYYEAVLPFLCAHA